MCRLCRALYEAGALEHALMRSRQIWTHTLSKNACKCHVGIFLVYYNSCTSKQDDHCSFCKPYINTYTKGKTQIIHIFSSCDASTIHLKRLRFSLTYSVKKPKVQAQLLKPRSLHWWPNLCGFTPLRKKLNKACTSLSVHLSEYLSIFSGIKLAQSSE